MLSSLSATAPVASAAPPPTQTSGAAPAGDEPAADGFARALDHAADRAADRAADKQSKGSARERLRGAARLTAGGEAANATAKDQPKPMPMPTLVDGKNDQTMPPQAEEDSAGAGDPGTPQSVAALLAELRAAAAGQTAVKADMADTADTAAKSALASAPTAQSDKPRRLSPTAPAATDGAASTEEASATARLTAPTAPTGRARAEAGSTEDNHDSFAQHLAAAAALDKPTPLSDGLLSLPALLPPAATNASAAATPVQAEVHLPAAPGSAEFGPQLGAQISTFVRGGVEHARLHLNPAELGPVSVQIQLDGQNALVHLSAENAHTRQALEQALPLLAGSLREAGLTLSGGGVFEQPRQGGGAQADGHHGAAAQQDRGDDRGDERADGRNDGLHAGPAQVRRRGVVDLVA